MAHHGGPQGQWPCTSTSAMWRRIAPITRRSPISASAPSRVRVGDAKCTTAAISHPTARTSHRGRIVPRGDPQRLQRNLHAKHPGGTNRTPSRPRRDQWRGANQSPHDDHLGSRNGGAMRRARRTNAPRTDLRRPSHIDQLAMTRNSGSPVSMTGHRSTASMPRLRAASDQGPRRGHYAQNPDSKHRQCHDY